MGIKEGKKLKVLHIIANRTGGVPVVVKNLVVAQNKVEGLTARVLSLIEQNEKDKNAFYDDIEGKNIIQYLDSYAPNIVILHSFFKLEFIPIYKMLMKMQIPYIIEPHGSFGKDALRKSRLKKWMANKTIFKGLINHAKAYIFLNEGEMQKSRYRTQNDIIIPNGVVCDDKINIQEKSSDVLFYFIGRYDIYYKGIDILLSALDILEKRKIEINIDFYGSGNKQATRFIEKRIKKYRYIKCANKGVLTGTSKEMILSKYNIMILTSRSEGLPMTVLEAWNMGIPCLVSEGTNVSHEAVKNGTGWLSGNIPEEIAECIYKAKVEYSLNKDVYIERCINYIRENYQWSEIALLSKQRMSFVLNSIREDKR